MRFKLRFEVEVEYAPDSAHYPEDSRTPELMLALDLESAKDDPFMMLSYDADWKITGELLK